MSQLLGAPVTDQHDVHLGKITDVLMLASQVGRNETTYPTVIIVESEEDQQWRVPYSAIEKHGRTWRLRSPSEQFTVPPQSSLPDSLQEEVSLVREVLDKQVIDLEHKKAVRVNDVSFDNDWHILGIDNSTLGLLRRLIPSRLLGTKPKPVSSSLIPWNQVELIGSQHLTDRELTNQTQIQLIATMRTPSGHLAELHPADIATIIHQLTAEQGARVIERLDDETAADTMEEVDTERQILILENIQPERAAAILQAMGPDEAADLLARMPEEQKQQFLRQMAPEDSEDVQELLEYEADTAGGLMTTDYIVLNQTRTVQEALAAIRTNIQENDVRIAYIYCVADETEDECRPLGVVTLWDLLAVSPSEVEQSSQTLQDLMETDLITVQPDTDPRTVVEIMAKYNLLAVPVVSTEGILEGVVTVDDALDVLLPHDRRRKPRRMY
ncbi:MAG TPA: CBS domain-containing protein [Ktedonobacteraceae bacterium]